MTDAVSARRELLDLLATIARPGQSLDGVADDTDLVAAGIVDSLAVVSIILYVEGRAGAGLDPGDIDPTTLTTLGGILRLVERRD